MSLPAFQEVRIENTNSCAYKCTMCPREKLTRSIGFMSLDDFSIVLDRVGVSCGNFHLHGFGEPLLDRKLALKLERLKQVHPNPSSLIFSTLGVRVPEDHFMQLLESGLNRIVISLYGFTEESYQKIHGFNGFHTVKQNLQRLSQAMRARSHSFHATVKIPAPQIASSLPILLSSEREDFCQWLQELGFSINEWSYVHNYGDGRTYNLQQTGKMCPVVNGNRRNVLNITWDLNVIPCCFDFNSTIRFGNLRKQTLDEIFASPEYLAFLIAHRSEDLSAYPVCQNCEKNDY